MVATITPQKLAEIARRDKVIVLDVRTPAEFRETHVPFAENWPLERLDAAKVREHFGTADAIYTICRSGGRGSQACQKLQSAGLNVVNVEGGTLGWESAGLPVIRGKKTISLERQVRIVAGSLVFVGAVLAILVHPGFAGLAAFIGAGLVFAGVTDTCGMAMLLARMPWNQAGGEESSTAGVQSCSISR